MAAAADGSDDSGTDTDGFLSCLSAQARVSHRAEISPSEAKQRKQGAHRKPDDATQKQTIYIDIPDYP